MLKTLGLSVLFFTSFFAAAQDAPKFEVFGGYSYANTSGTLTFHRVSMNGWNASAAANFNRWFGVIGDFGGHYGSPETTIPVLANPLPPCASTPPFCLVPITLVNSSIDIKAHTFLAGPQFSWRTSRFTLFAHELMGAEHVNAKSDFPTVFLPRVSRTPFALALGGGMDVNLNSRLSWRLQADYLRTFDFRQRNFRASTGVVFKFGNK